MHSHISKYFIFLLTSVSFITVTAQTGEECGCGEYPASVIVETVGDPCSPPDLGNDDGSLKRVYEHECCMKRCKEKYRAKQQAVDYRNKNSNQSSNSTSNSSQTENNSTLTKEQQNVQNIIDSQNKRLVEQDRINQKIASDLTATFTQIADNWAKERDFQNKVSSLTNIQSIDAASIISEARSKAQQINTEYSQQKRDALNQGVAATQDLMNSAQNEEQVIAGGLLGAGITALSQSNIEKERKEAQQKLEEDKERALNKLAQQIADKYAPIKEQHQEAAIFAVLLDEQSYHLANYQYAKCMEENAYQIIAAGYECEEPSISKPNSTLYTQYSGQDYYDAYLRKLKVPLLQSKAEYFLELAIEKQPRNDEWIFERITNFELTVPEEVKILEYCLTLNSTNTTYKDHRDEKLSLLVELNEALKKYHSYLKKQDEIKSKEENLIEKGFVTAKYCADDLFLVSKYSGKTVKRRISSTSPLKEEIKLEIYGYTDEQGNTIIPIRYNELGEFSEGKAVARIKSKYGFIDLKEDLVIPFKYHLRPSPFINGHSITKALFGEKTGDLTFIDTLGNNIFDKKYNELSPFSDGLAFAGKSGLSTYSQNFIDNKGNVQIPLEKYYTVQSFSEGLAQVELKDKKDEGTEIWGFINKEGIEVIKPIYDYVTAFKNGHSLVLKNGKFGVINPSGEIVLPIIYDSVPLFSVSHKAMRFGELIPNHFFLLKDGKWGLLNGKGKKIYPFEHDNIQDIIDLSFSTYNEG